jgi:hypothetical protein
MGLAAGTGETEGLIVAPANGGLTELKLDDLSNCASNSIWHTSQCDVRAEPALSDVTNCCREEQFDREFPPEVQTAAVA